MRLEALAVDNGGTRLVVLLLGDPVETTVSRTQSFFFIAINTYHIIWKVDSEARMEPPIQTEYLRSGGATILIFIEEGARAVISFCMRSAIPGYMVVPPDCEREREKKKSYARDPKKE